MEAQHPSESYRVLAVALALSVSLHFLAWWFWPEINGSSRDQAQPQLKSLQENLQVTFIRAPQSLETNEAISAPLPAPTSLPTRATQDSVSTDKTPTGAIAPDAPAEPLPVKDTPITKPVTMPATTSTTTLDANATNPRPARAGTVFDPRLRARLGQQRPQVITEYDGSYTNVHGENIADIGDGRCIRAAAERRGERGTGWYLSKPCPTALS